MARDKKKIIINAATKSFSLYGYKATTMDHVAKIAKVGKATIYTFFSTKEELFQEIIDDLAREMKEVALEEIDRNQPFSRNLHQSLIRILDYREKHSLTIKLYQEVKEFGTPACIDALARLEEEIIAFIEKEVHYALDKGELKACDPKITAFIILKMYISLAHVWGVKHDRLSKEDIANLFNLYLMDGLAK
ncbi:TetR/AcrR family transcriptional regulator [Alkalihalobacterium alkalinitrilicum]|uniref:TetR/AcrR family transcriptional regulator n=1 Tax=Alkalihalobacterium alkalinitrilicum TaxID=427920 RepID=UPI000995C25B|nr:TetR/AcrR family transcriptional regulator [Alkalihalobacterium alkalinitrilicum]